MCPTLEHINTIKQKLTELKEKINRDMIVGDLNVLLSTMEITSNRKPIRKQ